MQHPASELPRIYLLGTWLNRGKKNGSRNSRYESLHCPGPVPPDRTGAERLRVP
jgi:hypothetical protein